MGIDKFTFKYKFNDNYNPVYINGAFGGLSTKGEIVANFFLERPPVPYQEENEVTKDGNLGARIQIKPEEHNTTAIRYVSTGIVMNIETAKLIHGWLGLHIKNYEEINKNGEG